MRCDFSRTHRHLEVPSSLSRPFTRPVRNFQTLPSTFRASEKISKPRIAYFSMEVGFDPKIPTYSGGLGILAGDHLKAAADLGLPLVGVTLLYRKGYFEQVLDQQGWQSEREVNWHPEQHFEPLSECVHIPIENRTVEVGAWRTYIKGHGGYRIPLLFLDTDRQKNDEWDRHLTDRLYGGNDWYRLCQEIILGLGGLAMLEEAGYAPHIKRFHMNEGHASFISLGLLQRQREWDWHDGFDANAIRDRIRSRMVFTTHTPVAAGHDAFPAGEVKKAIGDTNFQRFRRFFDFSSGKLNMTWLGIQFSNFINGVSLRHGEVARQMFPGVQVDSITNGVHAPTWISEPVQRLLDRKIPDWRENNARLKTANIFIKPDELRRAHQEAKRSLMEEVKSLTGQDLDQNILTLGFARRAATYKRHDFPFQDLNRLLSIGAFDGPVQFIYAGKAHPHDQPGKDKIHRMYEIAEELRKRGNLIRLVYLPNYDMRLGKLMTGGVDVWLNTPEKPLEASGTSGMKAGDNGVLNFSILDGWWVEGCHEGVTGWAIGYREGMTPGGLPDHIVEPESFYRKLSEIAQIYYNDPKHFAEMMLNTMAINGPEFSMQRVVRQYWGRAYNPITRNGNGESHEISLLAEPEPLAEAI